MDDWPVERLMILAGGLGMVVGAVLASEAEPLAGVLVPPSLLLLGLAAWHLLRWGLGKLIAVGLLAVGGLWINLADSELVARWLMVASAAVVLLGVLWSFVVELYPREGERSFEEVAASLGWWRKWGLAVVGIAVGLGIGWQVYSGSEDEDALPIDTADQGDAGDLQDEWSISADGEDAGSYIFSMIRTFSPLEEADVEDLGGRFVWPETEIELCDVNIWGVGDGFVQIGIISPTTEGCPGMLLAFVDFGLPETACLLVRSDGVDDEYCAPLAVD